MESEISVKILFNGDMRRFPFQGSSFKALKDSVASLLGLEESDVLLKYFDEEGDLITLSSDLELKTAAVPGKVLRLKVAHKGVPLTEAVSAVPPLQQRTIIPPPANPEVQPMEVSSSHNPFQAFGAGCGVAPPPHPHAPPHGFHHGPPPHFHGFQPPHLGGYPHPPPPHHGGHPHPSPPHHRFGPHPNGPFPHPGGKHEWAKMKEERKNAKRTLSPEEYKVYKEQNKHLKDQFKHWKKARKHGHGHGHDHDHGYNHGYNHGHGHGHPHHPPPPPFPVADEWAKHKEEWKKAKKTLSPEEYKVYKQQNQHLKDAHKQAKEAHKQAKEAAKEDFKEARKAHKRGGKWGGGWGRGRFGPGFPHPQMHPHAHPFQHGPPPPGMPFAPPFPHSVPHDGQQFVPGFFPTPFGGQQFSAGEPKLIARHVKDVTIEDGTQLPPGTPFVKTWRVRNEGPAWPPGCQLHFLSKRCGDVMGGPDFVIIDKAVETNQELDITVNLVAPTKPGRYVGFWKLCTPAGRKFGQRMWVSVVVPSLGGSSSDEEERSSDRYEVLVDAVLAKGGFTVKRHRVFGLLQKHDGDVQKVYDILVEKAQRRADRAARG